MPKKIIYKYECIYCAKKFMNESVCKIHEDGCDLNYNAAYKKTIFERKVNPGEIVDRII
jgi:hypothetical protein